jgi:hypothetical protein
MRPPLPRSLSTQGTPEGEGGLRGRWWHDSRVPLPAGVTPEQAAEVFRRAAELEGAGSGGDGPLLDDGDLEEVGREVGLTPASVRAALAEWRAGALVPGPEVRWGIVISARVVPGSTGDVLAVIDDEARRNQLGVVRRAAGVTVWSRAPGVSAAIARGLRGRRRHPLLGLGELRATVVEASGGPGAVRVRLEGSLVPPWQLLSGRGRALATIGIGGGALMAFVAAGPWSLPDWQYDLAGSLGALAGTGAGLRSYRRGAAAVEAALDAFVDRLAGGAAAVVHMTAPVERPTDHTSPISEDRVPLRSSILRNEDA